MYFLPITIMMTMFVAAGIIIFVKSNAVAKKLAVATHLLALAFSGAMLWFTAYNPISLIIGVDPFNFYMLVTPLDSFMVSMFVSVGLLITWASLSMIDHDVEPARIPTYYSLMCALIGTLVGVVIFENFVNVFLLAEASSFAAAGIDVI